MLQKDSIIHLFKAEDYRRFLAQVLRNEGKNRGYKKRLAESAGCQPAYLSQVMAGSTHLTPEQAERLCSFWEFNPLEADYFFNLVLLGRAGTTSLKNRLHSKLIEIRNAWTDENQSFGTKALSEPERAAIYYSHFLNSAIHLLLTIPEFQTAAALAKHLRKSETEIEILLNDLQRAGLVEFKSGHWRATHAQIHAPAKDFFAEVHHKNWRSQAIEVRAAASEVFVRYTSVHSISKEDAAKLKAMINQFIEDSRRLIEPSKEEMGACLLIDYFAI